MRRSHTIITPISHDYAAAYRYVADPANFGDWSGVQSGTYRLLDDGDWAGLASDGLRRFRFTAPNDYGVLDHEIAFPDGSVCRYPMRLVPNEGGCELHFTYFAEHGLSEAEIESIVGWITMDFQVLKSLLEGHKS